MNSLDIANYLECEDINKLIDDSVGNINVMNYTTLLKKFGPTNILPKHIHDSTKFVNIHGFLDLLDDSDKNIRKWLKKEVLTILHKYELYMSQLKKNQN